MPKKKRMIWFRFARFCCRIFCQLFFRIHVYGKENIPDDGALVLVSNHQSFIDPLFCGVFLRRPLYFLARESLFDKRFFGKLISSVNSIPIRRGQADLSSIKKVISILKNGNAICLFPEGTRTNDGKIAEFRPGFGLLCRRGHAAVVPVVLDGAFECWPRHKKIFSPGRSITVRYGKVITAEQVSKMDDKQLAGYLTNISRRMQNELRAKNGKEPLRY